MTCVPLAIDAAHPAFPGHFPSRAIVPGVVLLDASLRALEAHFDIDKETIASTTCRIGSAKFLSPVAPGEALRLEVDATIGAGDEPGPRSSSYKLRVFAGAAGQERMAVTGIVSFEPRSVRAADCR